MNKTDNVGNTQIKSAEMLPATPSAIYVNMNEVYGKFDLQHLEDEADAVAIRQCVERRAGRAIRMQRRANKAAAAI